MHQLILVSMLKGWSSWRSRWTTGIFCLGWILITWKFWEPSMKIDRNYTVFACSRVCSKTTQAAFLDNLYEISLTFAWTCSSSSTESLLLFGWDLFGTPTGWTVPCPIQVALQPPKRRRGWCGSTLSVSVAGGTEGQTDGCEFQGANFVEKSAASWNMSIYIYI